MPKLVAETAAQQPELSKTNDMPDLKILKPVKMRDLLAANSTKPKAATKATDDVEDMWDNMPV